MCSNASEEVAFKKICANQKTRHEVNNDSRNHSTVKIVPVNRKEENNNNANYLRDVRRVKNWCCCYNMIIRPILCWHMQQQLLGKPIRGNIVSHSWNATLLALVPLHDVTFCVFQYILWIYLIWRVMFHEPLRASAGNRIRAIMYQIQ